MNEGRKSEIGGMSFCTVHRKSEQNVHLLDHDILPIDTTVVRVK